jgi:hypothetical protein
MLSDAFENSDVSACSMANPSTESWLGFLLGLLFSFALGLLNCLQLEAAPILLMTLHITELALDKFGLVLGRRFMFKRYLIE